MADMRLADFGLILGALLLTGVAIFSVMALIVLWPRIVSIISQLSARARAEGVARAAYRQQVYSHDHMSNQKVSRTLFPIDGNQRTAALDRSLEPMGTALSFRVPPLWEQLEQLSDDELLDVLAQVRTANGDLKYADSRIAKFVGGRVDDRVQQVRDVRGKEAPAKAMPMLRVRSDGMERLIAKFDKH